MTIHRDFISKSKSMLIAAAGCGKTHAISECLLFTEGKSLILTHTHAGVASLKEKIKKLSIPYNKYRIETIISFAQKFVLSFYIGEETPGVYSKNYYQFIINKASELVLIKPIAKVIHDTFSNLFVDEYQDCTKSQHKFVSALSTILPTHIVGDHLQGIYDFSEKLVDLNNTEEMVGYKENIFHLNIPWRWKQGNELLGEALNEIRNKLINNEDVDLNDFRNSINYIPINEENEIFKSGKRYCSLLWRLAKLKDVLLIHPDEAYLAPRLKIIKHFNNSFSMVEAIDDKDFYNISKKIDNLHIGQFKNNVKKVLIKFFNTDGVSYWFNDRGLIKKRKKEENLLTELIKYKLVKLDTLIDLKLFVEIIYDIEKLPKIKCYRKELFIFICSSLEYATENKISVYDAMIHLRNKMRRIGKKIYGRSIGTTLLTKGLEFENVAVLNAHNFKSPKHLYVAFTRASKELFVFSKTSVLHPYMN